MSAEALIYAGAAGQWQHSANVKLNNPSPQMKYGPLQEIIPAHRIKSL